MRGRKYSEINGVERTCVIARACFTPDLGEVTSPGQWAPLVCTQLTTLVPYPHHLNATLFI
jgi:hypothetical protein